MYTEYAYLSDKEGAGKYRGSVAIVRGYKLLSDEAVLQLRVDRQRFGPYGLHGGQAGLPLEVVFNPDGENLHLGKTTMTLKKGDVLKIIFAGAGGWGSPLERDVDMVLNDVLDEKISTQRASDVYGVVIDEKSMKVDVTGTQKLREEMEKVIIG